MPKLLDIIRVSVDGSKETVFSLSTLNEPVESAYADTDLKRVVAIGEKNYFIIDLQEKKLVKTISRPAGDVHDLVLAENTLISIDKNARSITHINIQNDVLQQFDWGPMQQASGNTPAFVGITPEGKVLFYSSHL